MSELVVNTDAVLDAISPKVGPDGALRAPALEAAIDSYDPEQANMWSDFLDAEPGSVQEENFALGLANYYLLKTAEKLQVRTAIQKQNKPRDEKLWTDRFNLAGSELFGQTESAMVTAIARQDGAVIRQTMPDSFAAFIYNQISDNEAGEIVENDEEVLDDFRATVLERFEEITDTINALPEGPYSPAQVRNIFGGIIKRLSEKDKLWEAWEITNPKDKTMLSVVAAKKHIEVPDGRASVDTKQQLLGLALHEIGVHAQRAINGERLGDPLMQEGLPRYSDFEEGLGILLEYLTNPQVLDKANDRYIDIALASGAINGITLTRDELIPLGISRTIARAIARGEPVLDNKDVRKTVNAHVNRIFRGGPGEPIRNAKGNIAAQAVFGKDLLYYDGYIKARDFVVGHLKSGTSAEDLLDFLLSGKFDVTNARHVGYLKEKHALSL